MGEELALGRDLIHQSTTPQGDGNHALFLRDQFTFRIKRFIPTTPQGDGNDDGDTSPVNGLPSRLDLDSSIHYPARGRKLHTVRR